MNRRTFLSTTGTLAAAVLLLAASAVTCTRSPTDGGASMANTTSGTPLKPSVSQPVESA